MKIVLGAALVFLFAIGCRKNNDNNGTVKADVVYVENNNYNDNQNAVFAYYNLGHGNLQALPGSPFLTGGAGIANPTQKLGPDDSDTQLKLSADGHFLIAINPGSNTIAVFAIQDDGSLKPVSGSPFPSGGNTPVSVDVKGKYVYVVNKSMDSLHPATQNPDYTTFTIDHEGALAPVAGSTVETTAGTSPSQILVSNNGHFAFGCDFLGFMLTPAVGTLRSFTIGDDGKLTAVSGSPYMIPGMGGALGLWQHPNSNVLYVGFPVQGKVGIYTVENNGSLDFQSTIDGGPASCWIRTTSSGNNLYVLNSGENTISMFNSSNATAPTSMGKIALKQSGPLYTAMGASFTTSEDFGLAFSPDESNLYVVSQHTNADFSIGNFNYLHTLDLSADGTLSENAEPLQLPVDPSMRPQGVVVVKATIQKSSGKY